MSNALQQAQQLGQSMWYDNIRRGLLTSGDLEDWISQGITGITSNPTIFEKAIAGSNDYDSALMELAEQRKEAGAIFEALAVADIQSAADLLRPVYEETKGADGYVSIEVNPALAHDTEGTVAEARRLFRALDRSNVMVKVPATREGIPAIRKLISEGVNVNVTLIFGLETYRQVREAYIAGLEELERSGGDVSSVASVASFFVSRVDSAIDKLIDEQTEQGRTKLKAYKGTAAIANAKLAYRDFKETFGSSRFASLSDKGARVQRPLWASTGTKNPLYSDVLYVESLIGPDTVNTMPHATLVAFLDHGKARAAIEEGVDAAEGVFRALKDEGIDMAEVTAQLLTEGVASFAASYGKLLANVTEKKERLRSREAAGRETDLGEYGPAVDAALQELRQANVVERIYKKDHTVWRSDPTEITDRLGWLYVTDVMRDVLEDLRAFSETVRLVGFRHVVLLGMGGSSLGPEVLRQTFGNRPGYPELHVLDTTVPASVLAVAEEIDPARTLFLVSSKSGGTVEPNSLYRHFRALVDEAVGAKQAGEHFVAITDPGTSLERLAERDGFRRTFLNPADIGGRYSVLSCFGLVPAALLGIDLEKLLDRADCMREGCAPCVKGQENPALWLGAVMGAMALQDKDKLSLVTSKSIESFGLWAEQLIAESTGKEGKGIIPVAQEPLLSPDSYGDDRLFVYLRVEEDDNADLDIAIDTIRSSGHPVVRLDLRDRYDLGSEFYRWELATGVAGSALHIHPFDQPNVQQAKDITDEMLRRYKATGSLPEAAPPAASVDEFLNQVHEGDYVGLMVYAHPTRELDQALRDLRLRIAERHRVATTLGYGPRFLHSTGQLHKGGPDKGLFLQLVDLAGPSVEVPGEAYTFNVLAQAQALGDLKALRDKGRRVARVDIGGDAVRAVQSLLG